MDRSISAGISGFILAIVISLFLSPILTVSQIFVLVPPFLAAIFIIAISRLVTIKDGLVASLITYIFYQGILSTLDAATFYFENQPYPSFDVDILTVISQIAMPISALVAAYLGVLLARRMRPARESQPQPSLPPPIPPV